MTNKDCFFKVYQERIKIIDLTIGLKFDECRKVLETHHFDCHYYENEDILDIKTDFAIFTILPNNKGYIYLDDNSIQVWNGANCLGIFTYKQVLSKMGEEKSFIIQLIDSDDESVKLFQLETQRTLKQFEKAYKKFRNNWYKEETPDCLFDYLMERLDDMGFYLYEIKTDLSLDF